VLHLQLQENNGRLDGQKKKRNVGGLTFSKSKVIMREIWKN
jgi:hypothetical protein